MKTPKRAYKQDVCPKCGSVVHWYSEEVDNGTGYETVDAYGECCNEDCNFSVKGLRDHDGWEDHQQEARWIRKNREARLRHKIAVLKKQVKKAYEKGIEVERHANNLHRAREEGSYGILKKEIQWDDLSVDDWRKELAREYELELTIDKMQLVLSEAHYLYMYCDEGKIIVTDCDVDYYAFVNAEYLVTESSDVESSERFYKWEPAEGVWLPQNVVGTADNADDAYRIASTDWYGRHKRVIRTVWEHYGPEDEVNWRIAYHILGQAEMTPLKFGNEKGEQQ